jgi:hypothetical protein
MPGKYLQIAKAPQTPDIAWSLRPISLLSKQGISSRITGNASVAFTEFSCPKHGTQIGAAERRRGLQPQTLVRLEGAQLENEVAQQAWMARALQRAARPNTDVFAVREIVKSAAVPFASNGIVANNEHYWREAAKRMAYQ